VDLLDIRHDNKTGGLNGLVGRIAYRDGYYHCDVCRHILAVGCIIFIPYYKATQEAHGVACYNWNDKYQKWVTSAFCKACVEGDSRYEVLLDPYECGPECQVLHLTRRVM
jgi:hypothetical protein